MNLRILKKLSKRAAPLLPLLGDDREQFPAEKGANYMSALVLARKHFERGRSVHGDRLSEHEIKRPAADGRGWVYARPPRHPRAGTIMVGGLSGYYQPEWDEETAWCALSELVRAHFTDWCPGDDLNARPVLLRDLSMPALIFEAASEILTTKEAKMTDDTFAHTVSIAQTAGGRWVVTHSWKSPRANGWFHSKFSFPRRQEKNARAHADRLRAAFPNPASRVAAE